MGAPVVYDAEVDESLRIEMEEALENPLVIGFDVQEGDGEDGDEKG